jgi:hypothetical protein
MQLPLGGKKIVKEALRQSLDRQAMSRASHTLRKPRPKHSVGNGSHLPREETTDDLRSGSVRGPATFGATSLTKL